VIIIIYNFKLLITLYFSLKSCRELITSINNSSSLECKLRSVVCSC